MKIYSGPGSSLTTPVSVANGGLGQNTIPNNGVCFGLTISNGTDTVNDINIAAGVGADSAQASYLKLTSVLTKQSDVAWAVGTNQGGLDTGTVGNGTYHIWLIRRSDTGVVDALFSLSASAPTMPTNYDQKCRIGSIVRAGGTILQFTQYGDWFWLSTPVLDINSTNPGTSAVTRVMSSIPTGFKFGGMFMVRSDTSASGPVRLYLSSLDLSNIAPSTTAAPLANISGNSAYSGTVGPLIVWTDTSSQIRSRVDFSDANVIIRISTLGWIDNRGRDGQ